VVVSDPLLLDHVIRRMRSDPGSQLKSMKSIFAYYLTTDKSRNFTERSGMSKFAQISKFQGKWGVV